MPGVPHEMKDMVQRAVLPDLLARSGEASVIVSRTLRTWGESESGLNERLDPVIDRLESEGNPTLAFLASGWEGIKVRLTAKAATDGRGARLLDRPWEAEVRALVGDIVFGVDDDTMESVVLQLLRERGLIARPRRVGHRRPGRRSHHQRARCQRGVPRRHRQLRQRGEVRPARRARGPGGQRGRRGGDGRGRAARAAVPTSALALTGVAGPAEQDGMPVGTLCVGIAIGADVHTRTLRLPGQRDQMRQMSVISALDLLRRRLLRAS